MLSPGSEFGPILLTTMSHKRLYRSDLFGPERFASTDALERVLQELQSIFTKDNFKHVSQKLFDNESPNTLLGLIM